jgi:signal transduction histidine kinase
VSVRPTPTDLAERFAADTSRTIRARLLVGAVTFLAVIGLAATVELAANPARAPAYWIVFGMQAAAWGVAGVVVRRRPASAVATTTVLALVLVGLITSYHVVTGGQSEILVLALGYLIVGCLVLFPWGGRGQFPLVAGTLVAYGLAMAAGVNRATPVGLNLLGLGTIGALTVAAAIMSDRRRFELFRRTVELEAANAALAEANRAKTQFLAHVSHELRTPLDAVIGYLQLIDEETFGAVPPPLCEPLQRVRVNTQMLMRLTNDFLDLSRLDASKLQLHLEDLSLAPICAEAVELVSAQLRGKEVDLVQDVPVEARVHADRDRVRQILVNLLSNAIKFTKRGRIEMRLGDSRDGVVVLDVRDSGAGIPVEEQQAIFEPFHRGSAARDVGGVGIGLTLSRQLAEAMGGAMGVSSRVGQGSTFSVRLPCAKEGAR